MYKYEFIVIYKFIQFLLYHDIALCSDSYSWQRHASVNQINQIEPFLKKQSNDKKPKVMFLSDDSHEKYRPVGIELIKLEPRKIEPETIPPKIIEERAYVAAGKLENQKPLPLFKVKLETKNFKIPALTTTIAKHPKQTIINSKNTCSKEKKSLKTTTMTTFYRAFYKTEENVVSEKIHKFTETRRKTTAKEILPKGTSLRQPTIQGNTSTTARVIKRTASHFMFFNEYFKAKDTYESHTRSIDTHNVFDVIFVGNKSAVDRQFQSNTLESRKKHVLQKLSKSLNKTKLVENADKTKLFRSVKKIKLMRNANKTKTIKKSSTNFSLSDFSSLHPHIIAKQLRCLQKQMESSQMRITQEIIGRTAGYNDIVLWKLEEPEDYRRSKQPACKDKVADEDKFVDDEPEKKIIFIVHGLSVMGQSRYTCFRYIADFKTLLSYYADNLDAFDIYLIPMANPDGVAKVLDFNMWNKNLSPQSACPGVNVDRNFDVAWNESLNVSSCSQLYPGPHPFSEQESSAVKNVLHKYAHKIIGYFHVHLGEYNSDTLKGEAVLYPRGYTADQGDDDRYLDLRGEIDEAMKNMSFRALSVTIDTLYSWYGKISGSSVDYASTIFGVPYALELIMQLYSTDRLIEAALTEVWQNVFDVIFDHISRSQKKKDGYDSIKEYDNDNKEGNDKNQKSDSDSNDFKKNDDDDKKGDEDNKEGDSSDNKDENNDKNNDKNDKNCKKNDLTLRKGKNRGTSKKKLGIYFRDSNESD